MENKDNYLPISDYALLSDCRSTALVSRLGSIDWCCMPRMDSDSCFGKLLDAERGGYCAITPAIDCSIERRYEAGTLILTTHFSSGDNRVEVRDFFCCANNHPSDFFGSEIIRVIAGISGNMAFNIEVLPRFDFGETIPQIVARKSNNYVVFGSKHALAVASTFSFNQLTRHELSASVTINAGQRECFSLRSFQPCDLAHEFHPIDQHYADRAYIATANAWRDWLAPMEKYFRSDAEITHSALVLKALTYSPSGAMIAAPTTSLPETPGGERNWDYRFCWIRDSVYATEILFKIGLKDAANQLRAFIERSCAGSAEQLQTLYAVDGGRRCTEICVHSLAGYRNSAPIRIGNDASTQHQWDMYGELLQLAWLWYGTEHKPDADYWNFLVDVLNHVCARWHEPDCGIWEFRDRARHLVHSKTCCWAALNYGVRLAKKLNHKAPLNRWARARDAIRDAINLHGFDVQRGIFRQAFDSDTVDAAALRLPRLGFIDACDERMISSVDVIRRELDCNGLLRRHNEHDGLAGDEGVFLPCTFWLVTCLAQQGKFADAQSYYRNAMGCANDLGLFSEEYDINAQLMLGNFPQALTHSSQIVAKMALRGEKADLKIPVGSARIIPT